MSKSLGNSPDPLDLVKQFGADGMRMGMMLCSPAGNDILYDDNLPEQGRNFSNKIWNAFRLVKGWNVDSAIPQPEHSALAIDWFNNMLSREMEQINDHFDKHRLSEAMMTVYKLFWDEFSSWLLEIIKPAYQAPIDAKTHKEVLDIFEKLIKLLHPFMPFITEELWQLMETRNDGESIMNTMLPEVQPYNSDLIARFELMKEVVAGVRTIRQDKNIPNKQSLSLYVKSASNALNGIESVIVKLAGLSELQSTTEKVEGSASFMVKSDEYFVPLTGLINNDDEIARLTKELNYAKDFLESVMKKLSNERFVNSAPAQVVDVEKKKQADAEEKIKVIEERLAALKK
jgi:valyl-tRNA synthetase